MYIIFVYHPKPIFTMEALRGREQDQVQRTTQRKLVQVGQQADTTSFHRFALRDY